LKTQDLDFHPTSPGEIKTQPVFNPIRLALVFSGAYFIICNFYIWISSFLAAKFSGSVADMQRIETIKGMLFILVTTLSIFAMLWFLLHRLALNEKVLLTQKSELIKIHGQAVSGVLASAVAHDMNNILSVLNFYLTELNWPGIEKSDSDTRSQITSALNDMKNLTRRMLYIGKENIPAEFKRFSFSELVKETLNFIRKHQQIEKKIISFNSSENVLVLGNEYTLRQLLINLLLNAAAAAKSQIEVRVLRQENWAVLEVHDDGPGISPEKKKMIFQPYYTSKVEGTGLGLLSVQVYTEIHRGQINLLDSHLGGACFQIRLPIVIS